MNKLKQIFKDKKPIILIGGVSGSGKSTMGNALVANLGIDHSIGTGWIREIANQNLNKEEFPSLFTHSFRPFRQEFSPFENFCQGTKDLFPYVKACINRAKKEGTSLLIEGVYLTPEIYSEELYDIFLIMLKPEKDEDFQKTIKGKTHKTREIYPEDLEANQKIQEGLINLSKKHNVFIIPFIEENKRIKRIIKIIKKKYLGKKNE